MRTARAILNLIAQEFFTATTLLVGLFATPLLIRWLGSERFGAFETCIDWCGYVAIPFFGIAAALMPMFADALGKNDRARVAATLAAGIRAYIAIALATIPLIALLVAAIPRLIPVASESRGDLRMGCALMLAAALIVPLGAFETLTYAQQRGYVVSVLSIARSLAITAGSLILAWHGFGIAGQAAATAGGLAIYEIAIASSTVRHNPGLVGAAMRASQSRAARERLRTLNRPSLIYLISERVSILTDNVVIAMVLSPAAVAGFFVTRQLAAIAQREIGGIATASFAGLGEIHAQGDRATLSRRIVELTRIVSIVGVTVLVPIAAYNRSFVALWVGSEHYGGAMLSVAAAIAAFVVAIYSLWAWVFSITGNIAAITPAMAGQTVLNLALSVAFTFKFGVAGPAMGTAVAIPSVSIWYCAIAMRRAFGVSLRALAMAVAAPLAMGVPYAAAIAWWTSAMGPIGWAAMAAQMTAWAAGFAALAWIAILNRGERDVWMGRVHTILHARTAA